MCARKSMASPRVRDPGDAFERDQQLAPAGALRDEDLASGRRQLVETAAALAAFLHPLPLDPTAALHAIEHRVERGDVKAEDAVRSVVDQLGDFVAMAGAP